MSASTASIPQCINSDAAFRAWASATHDLILAAGWVQTADTGQIDFATATLPAVFAYAGYEVFQRDDALQASAPIFCKVEYGQAAVATRVSLRVTFGTGSNGAGAITRPSAAIALTSAATPSAGEMRPGYACSLDGVGVVVEVSSPSATLCFAVERWRNADGTLNADGWSYVAGAGGIVYEGTYRVASLAWRERPSFSCLVPYALSASLGGDVGVFPHVPIYGTAKPPGLMFVTYFTLDISAASLIAVTRYGVARTYMTLGNENSGWGGSIATLASAMIYD